MVDLVALIIIGIAAAVLLTFIFRYLNAAKVAGQEPIIELEKLVNCTACGSLVPEGVNRCAFCGAVQAKPK